MEDLLNYLDAQVKAGAMHHDQMVEILRKATQKGPEPVWARVIQSIIASSGKFCSKGGMSIN